MKVVREVVLASLLITVIAGSVFASDHTDKKLSPNELLIKGVRRSNIEMITEALGKGASPNTNLYDDYPIILHMIESKSRYTDAYEIIKLFIEQGADIEFLNGFEKHSFSSVSMYCDDTEIIKLLINHGLKTKFTGLLEKFYYDYPMCKFLLEHGADPNEVTTSEAETPLHRAAVMGCNDAINYEWESADHRSQIADKSKEIKLRIIKMLIEKGADVNALNRSCSTPLHNAVDFNYRDDERLATVKLLIENGADVNALSGCNDSKESILEMHLDSHYPQFDITKILVDSGARIGNRGVYRLRNLPESKIAGLIVLSHGISEIQDKNTYKMVLQICSKKCDLEVIEKLFQSKWRPSINQELLTDCFESAAQGGNTETARFFVKKGARISNIEFLNGEYDNIEIEDLLPDSEKKQSPNQKKLDEALYDAVSASDIKRINDLLEKGADPNGFNCLHVAVGNYDYETVKILVRFKAEVNAKDKKGISPLMYACLGYTKNFPEHGLAIIKHLVENGGDVNAPVDNAEKTGLILCEGVASDDLELVELLLLAGADPSGVHPFDDDKKAVFYASTHFNKKSSACFIGIRWATHSRTKVTGSKNPYGDERPGFSYTSQREKKNNSLEILKKLVEYGADVKKAIDEHGHSLLHYACEPYGDKFIDKRVVQYLLENLSDISSEDIYNVVRFGGLEMFNVLVKRKQIINFNLIFEGAVAGGHVDLAMHIIDKLHFKNKKNQIDYYGNALVNAVKNDKGDMIDFLIDQGARVGKQKMVVDLLGTEKYKSSLIIAAAALNRTSASKHLYKYVADIDTFDTNGRNAIIAAAERGNRDVVAFLIKQKANLNIVSPKSGFTPLIYASKYPPQEYPPQHYNVVFDLLRNGADPLIKDNDGRTAVSHALSSSNYEIAALLTIYGADIINAPEFPGRVDDLMERLCLRCMSDLFIGFYKHLPVIKPRYAGVALIAAAKKGCVDITSFLQDKKLDLTSYAGEALPVAAGLKPENGLPILKNLLNITSDLNIKNKDGKTALQVAIENEEDDDALLAKYLMEYAVDVNVYTPDGMTPLMYASARSERALVKTMLDKNARVNYQMNNKDWGKYSKILWINSAKLFTSNFIKRFNEFNDAMKVAYKNSLYKGVTALMLAAGQQDDEILKLLIDAGAVVDARNNVGDTPLFIAALTGHTSNVSLLIKRGANISSVNDDGVNSLMGAAKSGHKDVVGLLLENGMDPNLPAGESENGKTALMYAAKMGHSEVVEVLLTYGCRTDLTTDSNGLTAMDLTDDLNVKELLLNNNSKSLLIETTQ